ncbi:unnamed protein product [Rhizophagus irregularis]|nr:unnamed protein product [Rhizophagus irregularis]
MFLFFQEKSSNENFFFHIVTHLRSFLAFQKLRGGYFQKIPHSYASLTHFSVVFFTSFFRYVGSVGWECGLGVWVGSLSYLCLGLLVIRSPLRPFFFTSLFRFIISLSRSSRSSSTYN